MSADMNVQIDFSTNAKLVEHQIKALNTQVKIAQVGQARLDAALRGNKASSKALTGDLRAKKSILKLDKQISGLAVKRMDAVTRGYTFASKGQERYVKGLIKTNEVMRIQRKIMDDNATAMVNMGKNTQWAGRQLVVGFTVPLTIAAGAAMAAFSGLEKEMIKFKRVYGDAFTTNDDLKEASKNVKDLAVEWTKYGVAVSETIDLAGQAAGAGFTGNQLTTQINSATKIAVLGELDKQKAMKATIALQSTFRMSNQELAQSINFLNQLENQTMVTMDDMTTAIPKAATIVNGLGGSIKDLGVFMSAMAEGGVTAAQSANALKSGLGSLLNPSKAARAELASIGVVMEDLWAQSEKNGEGIMFVVESLADSLERLGQTQKQMVMEELFGKHQFARMNALLSNINTGAQAQQAKGVAQTGQLEAALIAQRELGKLGESNLTKFQAAIERIKASVAPLGETLMGFVTPLLEGIGKTLEWFNKLPEVFKKIGLGMVAGLGIIAPLSLMLLGQIQNLLGQGMKFVNWIRHWGKETRWINTENLTLADTLSKVDAQLIAETTLLRQNSAAWGGRAAAATHSTAATAATIVTARRPRGGPSPAVTGMATGGSVGGTGNGDTVPALLTPGEFVVKKSVAEKFGNVLSAMNSGRLQGFSGGTHRAHLTARKEDDDFLSVDMNNLSKSDRGTLVKSVDNMMGNGLHPGKYIAVLSNLTRELPDATNTKLAGKGIPANELLAQWTGKNSMAQSLWSGGADRKDIADGKFTKSNQAFDASIRGKLGRLGNAPVTDKTLSSLVAKTISRMGPSHASFVNYLNTAAAQTGQIRAKNTSKLGQVVKAKRLSPIDLLLRPRGDARGGWSGANLKGARSFRGWGDAKWQKGLGMATGGFVPGTGNEDTVPAMLTPGEAVVKKSAAQKFGGILQAMNSGKLKMLSEGLATKDKGAPPAIRARIKDAFIPFDQLKVAIAEIAQRFKLDVEEMTNLVTADYERGPDAAHHQGSVDPVTGRKAYPEELMIADSKALNNVVNEMEMGGQNWNAMNQAAQDVIDEMYQTGASQDEIQAASERYASALGKVGEGIHPVTASDRRAVRDMGLGADPSKTTPAFRKNMITAAPHLSYAARDINGAPITAAGEAKMRTYFKSSGLVPTKGPTVKKEEPEHVTKPGGGGAQKVMGAAMALTMLTQFGGLSEKMGKFGDVLTQATTALFTMSMMGNMMPGVGGKMMGGLKGMKGASQLGGIASKAAGAFKFMPKMVAPGGLAMIAGGLVGNKIKDGEGGTRDVAGNTAKFAAMGAGLGMMFGPFGAGLGAATGALAGYVIQVRQNRQELEKATKAVQESAVAYSNIADQMEERYQIGGNSTAGDLITGVYDATKEQKELFKQLGEDMSSEDGPWQKRISDLGLAQDKGMYGGVAAEVNQLTMELRGRGVDEDSIEMVIKAFVQELPEKLKEGLESVNVSPLKTSQIIKDVDVRSTTAAASQLSTTWESLQNQILNLDSTSKDYKSNLAELNEDLEAAEAKIANVRGYAVNREDFYNTVGQPVTSKIESGEGLGLTVDQWKTFLDQTIGTSAVELTRAAMALMEAGVNLSTFTSPGQIIGYEQSLEKTAKWEAKRDAAEAERVKIEKDLNDLRSAKAKRDKDLDKYSGLIAEQERGKALDIKAANLSIEQIDLEEGALAKFTAKFNKAFGTSIDSFADAQYHINKISNQIQRINIKVIGPLQERVDDMNRKNELAQRKLDDLEETKQKRIDKINDAYDKQIDALKKIREQNEYIFDQQKNAVDMADALAKGDVAGAVNAMVESNRATADYTGTFAEQALQDQKDAALANNPEDAKISAIQAEIEARAARIEAIEDKIYRINENQIEPLERRSELMSLMLNTTQLELENQKANVNGIDMENFAREQALQSARESLRAAQEQKTKQDEIIETFRDQRRAIINNYETQLQGVHNVEDALAGMHAMNQQALDKATEKMDDWSYIASQFKISLEDGVAALQSKIKSGSVMEAIMEVIGWSENQHDKDRKKAMEETQKNKDDYKKYTNPNSGSYNSYIQPGQTPKLYSTGGNVPGSGGQDNVKALLTPGEYVMRKSAVKRIGLNNLDRMNRGDPNTGKIDTGGATKYATGGEVKPNFLGVFGDKIIPQLADAVGIDSSRIDESKSPTETGSIKPKPKSTKTNKVSAKMPAGKGNQSAIAGMEALLGRSTLPNGESVYRRCAANVGYIWRKYIGTPMFAGSATAAIHAGKIRNAGLMNSGRGPRGSVSYWNSSTGGGAGHVALNDGRGNSVNNWGGRTIERTPLNRQTRGYMGWSYKFNEGGLVPGASNYDSIDAALTPGEFVLNKAAVNNIGTGPLRALNSGSLGAMSQFSASAPANTSVTEGDVVYNYDYNLSFEITEASDANEVANVVLNKINTATRSRVRSR